MIGMRMSSRRTSSHLLTRPPVPETLDRGGKLRDVGAPVLERAGAEVAGDLAAREVHRGDRRLRRVEHVDVVETHVDGGLELALQLDLPAGARGRDPTCAAHGAGAGGAAPAGAASSAGSSPTAAATTATMVTTRCRCWLTNSPLVTASGCHNGPRPHRPHRERAADDQGTEQAEAARGRAEQSGRHTVRAQCTPHEAPAHRADHREHQEHEEHGAHAGRPDRGVGGPPAREHQDRPGQQQEVVPHTEQRQRAR